MWNCPPPPWCTDLLTPQNSVASFQNIFAIQLTHCPLPPPAYLGKWKSPPLEMGLHNISLNSITNKFVDSLQKHLPWPCPSSRVRVEICPGIFSWHRNFFRHVFWSLINCQKATSRLSQGPWRQRFQHKNLQRFCFSLVDLFRVCYYRFQKWLAQLKKWWLTGSLIELGSGSSVIYLMGYFQVPYFLSGISFFQSCLILQTSPSGPCVHHLIGWCLSHWNICMDLE